MAMTKNMDKIRHSESMQTAHRKDQGARANLQHSNIYNYIIATFIVKSII